MEVQNAWRIVMLGKYGSGISSLANTILGENHFEINSLSDLGTRFSQSKTKSAQGRVLTLIDSSGLFLPGRSEEDVEASRLSCMIECAPGLHAFLIVLKVEKFTEQEEDIITQICELFSEDALKYAAVVFTKGDQLPEETKISEFVAESKALSELVRKCGGRCHVFDNKYWKQTQQDEYRSNQFQVAELLKSIDQIVNTHSGSYYTNNRLQQVESEIQREQKQIRESSENMVEEVIREQAKRRVFKWRLKRYRCLSSMCRWGMRLVRGFTAIVFGVIGLKLMKSLYERMYDPQK
ncbi:GTPase IMAP family member 7-like [Salarias fasciatus]|uniref:GTPase IMAP family member 7-like n=1 Tax=Salarias fasciatus TaxID=181472 RepID=A0A672IIY5_SALFA|nr:GTPase IMAP family member 7-like [Salarias fasciatus]XP_029944082.1 GTPase IMAP family member 7-like [Salarias fasciatus]